MVISKHQQLPSSQGKPIASHLGMRWQRIPGYAGCLFLKIFVAFLRGKTKKQTAPYTAPGAGKDDQTKASHLTTLESKTSPSSLWPPTLARCVTELVWSPRASPYKQVTAKHSLAGQPFAGVATSWKQRQWDGESGVRDDAHI